MTPFIILIAATLGPSPAAPAHNQQTETLPFECANATTVPFESKAPGVLHAFPAGPNDGDILVKDAKGNTVGVLHPGEKHAWQCNKKTKDEEL